MMVVIGKGAHCLSFDTILIPIGPLSNNIELEELGMDTLLHAILLLVQHIMQLPNWSPGGVHVTGEQ